MPEYLVSGHYTQVVEADSAEEAIDYACDKIGNGWEWQAIESQPRPPAGATVETFKTFCYCKPPNLDANNVCRNCGTAWKKEYER